MKIEEIFFDIRAIVGGNRFNVEEMIVTMNNLLKRYKVNTEAYMRPPNKLEFSSGAIVVAKIFAGQDEYTFPFFKTGDAAVFLKDTGMSPATTIAKGNHLEILFKFFDLVGSELRINIKRRKKTNGILCEAPIIREQNQSPAVMLNL